MAYLLDADVFIRARNLHYGFRFLSGILALDCPESRRWDGLQHREGRGRASCRKRRADRLRANAGADILPCAGCGNDISVSGALGCGSETDHYQWTLGRRMGTCNSRSRGVTPFHDAISWSFRPLHHPIDGTVRPVTPDLFMLSEWPATGDERLGSDLAREGSTCHRRRRRDAPGSIREYCIYDGFQSPATGPASARVSPESHDAIVTISAWS